MQTTQRTWDDAMHQRSIDLQVKWQMTLEVISIEDVIPTRVNLRKDPQRTTQIGVHTAGGQRFLRRLIDTAAVEANITEKQLAGVQ